MGLFDIFKSNDKATPANTQNNHDHAQPEQNVKTLAELITIHREWKNNFSGFLDGKGGKYNQLTIGLANQCELGKWIYSTGKSTFADNTEFKELMATHITFHKKASEILELYSSGEQVKARTLFDSDFKELSDNLITLMSHLNTK